MSSTSPSSAPVERIKAVNHHLRVALDQVSEAVFILQNGVNSGGGPVVAWGNESAVRCSGIPGADLFGAPLQPLLTEGSWQGLLAALPQAFEGGQASCRLTFFKAGNDAWRGQVKATRGPDGEVLGVILTLAPEAVAETPAEASPASPPAAVADIANPSPPSPQGWQEDVIETIRETARQVAHEFNNALTSIVLPVQLAMREVPQHGDLYDSLEVAHVSAQRASDLAKDFLDCFRPRSAVRSRCAPAALLGRSIRLATCAQPVTSALDLQENLPEIDVDESQLERVIFNLIRNSVQAMPNGGRLRVAAVKRDITDADSIALPAGPYIQISVRDWGPGIAEEHLQHLFHGRFTTKPEGNGCGLPICYQIVRDHGGEMLVRSRVNVGTEFLIYLPAAQVAEEEEALPERLLDPEEGNSTGTPAARTTPVPLPAAPVPPPLLPIRAEHAGVGESTVPVELPFSWNPRITTAPVVPPITNPVHGPVSTTPAAGSSSPVPAVTARVIAAAVPAPAAADEAHPSLLVVDDEQGVRTALSQIARIMGFDVSTVATSDEALQTYKDRLHADRPYSTVLLDLNLRSGLNGMEVFQAIRRMDPEALVVATSGQHAEGDVERFRALGFAGFLPKPYSLEHFDSVMRAALAS